MNRLSYVALTFGFWFFLTELVGIAGWHLLVLGRVSLELADLSSTFEVLWFFVSIFGAAVVTRLYMRRRDVRQERG